jgi:hypothetical protein
MHSITHSKLMNKYGYAVVIFGIPLFIILIILGTKYSGYLLLSFILYAAMELTTYFLWKLPVYCGASGCKGQMQISRTRIAPFRSELLYQCKSCDYIQITHIFDPSLVKTTTNDRVDL